MDGTPTSPAEAERLLLRRSLAALLDLVRISRAGGDVIDPLIVGVVVTASVAPLSQDPGLEHAYATLEAPPPDPLRRPLPISAVARSLRLPFETTRRRIRHLVQRGVLEITPRGVVQTASAGRHPDYVAQSVARYARVRDFYQKAVADGLLAPSPGPAADGLPEEEPVRLVNRIAAEFILRCVDRMMVLTGDWTRGLLMLQIAHINGEDLVGLEGALKPVHVSTLAAKLDLATETARRHANGLERAGLVQRVTGGLVLTPHGLERILSAFADGAADLNRLFGRLAQLGVLDWWDREAAGQAQRSAG